MHHQNLLSSQKHRARNQDLFVQVHRRSRGWMEKMRVATLIGLDSNCTTAFGSASTACGSLVVRTLCVGEKTRSMAGRSSPTARREVNRNRNRIYYSNEMVIPNTTEVLSLTRLGSWPLYWRHASTPYVTVGACISLTGPLAHPSNLPVGGGDSPPDQLG